MVERTAELTEVNASLKEKNSILEKYKDITVGREHRVNDLKEKIKELEKKYKLGD